MSFIDRLTFSQSVLFHPARHRDLSYSPTPEPTHTPQINKRIWWRERSINVSMVSRFVCMWYSLECPVVVVYLAGCVVHFLKLQSSLDRQRPPCTWSHTHTTGLLTSVCSVLKLCASVWHSHNGADPSAVPLPHAPESRLASDIPQLHTHKLVKYDQRLQCCNYCESSTNSHLNSDVSFSDFTHVKAHSGDHILTELPRLNTQRDRKPRC